MQRKPYRPVRCRLTALLLAILILAACLPLAAAHAQTKLLSPTTGLPLSGLPVPPVMAIISYASADTRLDGKRVAAPGVEKCQPWGGLDADIVFETLLFRNGATRLVYLYHDALADGKPVSAGPIRSVRDAHVKLASFWQAGLICRAAHPYSAPGLDGWAGQMFDLAHQDRQDLFNYAEGRKGHDKMNADVNAVHRLTEGAASAPQMWSFGTEAELQALAAQDRQKGCFEKGIRIGWGEKGHTTSFRYDGETRRYSWHANNVPMKNWRDAAFTEEAPMVFDNVVILYVDHTFPASDLLPVADNLVEGGTGDALVCTRGMDQSGFWRVKDGRLLLETDGAEPMFLSPGRTYVAVAPADRPAVDEGLSLPEK